MLDAHREEIGFITGGGGIACVVHQPDAVGQSVARAMRWDGAGAVFEIRPEDAVAIAAALVARGENEQAHWLTTWRKGRVLWLHGGERKMLNQKLNGDFDLALGIYPETMD